MSWKEVGRLAPKFLIFIIFVAIILPASGFLSNLTREEYVAWLVPVGWVVLSCLAAVAVILAVSAWWRRRKGRQSSDDDLRTY